MSSKPNPKAPAWALQKIKNLEADLAHVKNKLGQAQAVMPLVSWDLEIENHAGLPDNARVFFWFGKHRDDYICVHHVGEGVEIHTSGSHAGRFAIEPHASNTIHVRITPLY